MRIYLDADSCPKQVRELIIRTSARTGLPVVFAANRQIPGTGSGIVMEICAPEEGAADNCIAGLAKPGDLVITRDVPLAERLIQSEVSVMDDRGRVYTKDNIRYYRSLRDFSVGLAENNMGMVRTPNYGRKELKKFADSFDRELLRLAKNSSV